MWNKWRIFNFNYVVFLKFIGRVIWNCGGSRWCRVVVRDVRVLNKGCIRCC